MALKSLLLRKKLDDKRKTLKSLREKDAEFQRREAELEAAIQEAETEEDRAAVEGLVSEFEAERQPHEEAVSALEGEIRQLEQDLDEEEARHNHLATPADAPANTEPMPENRAGNTNFIERKDGIPMNKHKTRGLGAMTPEQRSAFVARPDVQEFLTRFREHFAGGQQRAVTGGDLLIPTIVLGLIRQNIEDYSKLIRRVRMVSVSGTARQTIMGTIPEAVWTEMCATLNELAFTVNQVEVDGYKVGGYVAVCNALLEDAEGLLDELIAGIGAAIGIALDKAILFGTGVKMPVGITTRLAQTAKPADYPTNGRPWADLHTSNVVTITSANATGIKLFQHIAGAAGAAKGRYSRGDKFWVMNEVTYNKLLVEAMNVNASGAIVSSVNGVMPVIGGDVVVFGDDVMPDNTIIGGYGDLYLLVERAGTSVGYSDLPLYIQDQTVVKGTARYDGIPVIPEGFVVIGVGGAPTMTMDFVPDTANTVEDDED